MAFKYEPSLLFLSKTQVEFSENLGTILLFIILFLNLKSDSTMGSSRRPRSVARWCSSILGSAGQRKNRREIPFEMKMEILHLKTKAFSKGAPNKKGAFFAIFINNY